MQGDCDKRGMPRAKQINRPTSTVILSGVERERNAKRRIIPQKCNSPVRFRTGESFSFGPTEGEGRYGRFT